MSGSAKPGISSSESDLIGTWASSWHRIAVTDAMDEAQIMRATVDKHMGEKAKDWSDESIAASFAVLTKDAKPAAPGVQSLGAPVVIGDAEAAFADAQRKASEERRNAWKTPATSAAA